MSLATLFRRKTVADIMYDAEHGEVTLKRTLGAWHLTTLGIGAIIGAGLFSSIGQMAAGTTFADGTVRTVGAGPAIILSYVLTAIACGFAALCYAEIAAMVPAAGSAYTYSYVAFGELIAWIIGWDLIIEYAIGNIYVAQSWADYFQTFLGNAVHWQLPVWLTKDFQSATGAVATAMAGLNAADAGVRTAAQSVLDAYAGAPRLGDYVLACNLPAAGITILLTILLVVGVKESARFNAVMVAIKMLLIAAFIGIGFGHIDKKNWHPFAPNGFTGIWHGAALGFFSYIGFDAVSTASEETRNPQKDIPRGMVWSLVICTVLYIVTAAVLTGIVPWRELGSSQDPLASAFERIGMTGAATAFAFGAVIAMTAVLLVFQLGQTRIFMVMARDGLLPPMFARVHPKYRTPHVGTIFTGAFVAVMCSILTPDQAISLCNIGTLFAFLLVSLGVIVLRKREPTRARPFRVPGYPVTPLISALACIGLMFGLERSNWLRLLVWLVIGLVIYFGYGRRRSTLAR